MAVDNPTKKGVIEDATGDLLRYGYGDFTAGSGETVRTDVPTPSYRRGDLTATQMSRWTGAVWTLVDQPSRTPQIVTLADGDPVSLDPSLGHTFKLTASANRTVNASEVPSGARVIIVQVRTDDALFQRTITFATNFKPISTLTTPLASTKWITIWFHSDGEAWIEDGRQTAGA